jgi:hypothetical protein
MTSIRAAGLNLSVCRAASLTETPLGKAGRGVSRLLSYDFQAPAMHEKAGFVRMAELKDFPLRHTNTIFWKVLKA